MAARSKKPARGQRQAVDLIHTTLDDLIRQLTVAETAGRYPKKLQTYLRPAVLALDEVGLPAADPRLSQHGLQLISRRYERSRRRGATLLPGTSHCSATLREYTRCIRGKRATRHSTLQGPGKVDLAVTGAVGGRERDVG